MADTSPVPTKPASIHTPCWDEEARTPVVDGKYCDPQTGEVRVASGYVYWGPPAVDIVIQSLHETTTHCVYRAARPFAMEALLCHMAQVVRERDLQLDSLVATSYAIRIILAHELTVDEFTQISEEIANGVRE